MPGPLLSIALTVDEFDAGDYHWVLLESFDHSMEFEQLMTSAVGFASYIEALEAGFVVMRTLSADAAVGPREEADEDDPEDVDPATDFGAAVRAPHGETND